MTAPQMDTSKRETQPAIVKHRRQRARGDQAISTLLPAIAARGEEQSPKPRFDLDHFLCESEKQDSPALPMRVLLQNAKTHKFFSGPTGWTSDRKRAQDFGSGWWATVCAFTMNPRNLVIHYEFANDRYNLHIPVLGQPA